MAKVAMKHVFICALKRDRKAILETLQLDGTVQVVSSHLKEGDYFHTEDRTSASLGFRQYSKKAADALAAVLKEAPENKGMLDSLLSGKDDMSSSRFQELIGHRDEIMNMVSAILDLVRQKSECEADIPKIEARKVALEPWKDLDVPLNFQGTKTTDFHAGTFPARVDVKAVAESLKDPAEISILSETQQQTCVTVICEKKNSESVMGQLRAAGFSKAPDSLDVPAAEMKKLDGEEEQQRERIEELRKQIASYADKKTELKFAVDYYNVRADKYDVITGLAQSGKTFILEGWTTADDAPALEKELKDNFDCVCEFRDPKETEDPPVRLRNKGSFFGAVEPVIESYSLPGKRDFDPSKLVALFYYVLFGLMLSDAAYGIIMTVLSAVALKKMKNPAEGTKKFFQMFFYCGISTTFWGFMQGSFFGDAVNVIATTFFNRPDISLEPIWFAPLDDPIRMMGFCFAVGLLHLFVGLGAKLYNCIRFKDVKGAIFDVIFWYMLVGGLVVVLLTASMVTGMVGLSEPLPYALRRPAGIIAIIGAIGIVLTGGRESRNWAKRIMKGLYSLYGITSWLSDVLSYSRLLALGLATGVIASVFNKMGSMLGGGVLGAIVFIVIFVIGHTLNILINALSAYVHTNRLQYVEFFGKFYEGGGKKFKPFSDETKYYTIKEDV
ncbi:MAG: V-type ATP synthase subunit I [Lachnospiraceae bacterium]|jgi:V/A-type H+-transporting ATPase subunit I